MEEEDPFDELLFRCSFELQAVFREFDDLSSIANFEHFPILFKIRKGLQLAYDYWIYKNPEKVLLILKKMHAAFTTRRTGEYKTPRQLETHLLQIYDGAIGTVDEGIYESFLAPDVWNARQGEINKHNEQLRKEAADLAHYNSPEQVAARRADMQEDTQRRAKAAAEAAAQAAAQAAAAAAEAARKNLQRDLRMTDAEFALREGMEMVDLHRAARAARAPHAPPAPPSSPLIITIKKKNFKKGKGGKKRSHKKSNKKSGKKRTHRRRH